MRNIELAWLISMLGLIGILGVAAGLLEWGCEIAVIARRGGARLAKSQGFVTVVVAITVILPVFGVMTAFWTGDWRYLVLLVFLAPFFV